MLCQKFLQCGFDDAWQLGAEPYFDAPGKFAQQFFRQGRGGRLYGRWWFGLMGRQILGPAGLGGGACHLGIQQQRDVVVVDGVNQDGKFVALGIVLTSPLHQGVGAGENRTGHGIRSAIAEVEVTHFVAAIFVVADPLAGGAAIFFALADHFDQVCEA